MSKENLTYSELEDKIEELEHQVEDMGDCSNCERGDCNSCEKIDPSDYECDECSQKDRRIEELESQVSDLEAAMSSIKKTLEGID